MQAIYDACSDYLPIASRLVSSNADNYAYDSTSANIYDYGILTASGGNVTAPVTGGAAAGYSVSAAGSITSAVASTVARSDGLGFDQQIVITPVANSDSVTIGQNYNSPTNRVVAGQKIQAMCEVSLSGLSGANLKGINASLLFTASGVYAYATLSGAVSSAEFIQTDQVITVVFPEVTVPIGVTSINFNLIPFFGGAGTALIIKVGRVSIEKL